MVRVIILCRPAPMYSTDGFHTLISLCTNYSLWIIPHHRLAVQYLGIAKSGPSQGQDNTANDLDKEQAHNEHIFFMLIVATELGQSITEDRFSLDLKKRYLPTHSHIF